MDLATPVRYNADYNLRVEVTFQQTKKTILHTFFHALGPHVAEFLRAQR